MVAELKQIYTAPSVEAAETAMLAFADSPMGRRYPAAVAVWERAWERFIPFLAFPPEVRRIIYTTNAIVILSRLGLQVCDLRVRVVDSVRDANRQSVGRGVRAA